MLAAKPVKVLLDTYECNGCGGCAELCPDIFRMDETGDKARLLVADCLPLTPELAEVVKLCAQQCIVLERC
ncbi:ferredoxin [Desulfurivibrio alkaliphilus]|uniref:4Fe-4S ferredoxin iron-sulfur binding domain protein n=1 Tax=Desulfurivibrio alkaliphilus (strain DSM 19089 / UNIQEM U267 / AHT2) TaxID=589865 RepID=D6Z6W5_DESAT|nr:ferredoxin [Desulfurivibrio alkaliphilus]ADH86952.1 4Fe-4S ferredoxin iron-sulfur binding domain protein [Desulfurivibrio alkaliphilus AHT 2]